MKTGMMWFDNDPKKGLEKKVTEAALYYRQKYGICPDACQVNPEALHSPAQPVAVDFPTEHPLMTRTVWIDIKPNRVILPGNLWIGQEEHA